MEYEDKLVIRIITAVVIATLCACAFLVITVFGCKVGNDTTLAEKFKELDKASYHYDADNIFLYIDMQENIGAVYYGTVPLGHFELETNNIRFNERVFSTPTLIEN